MADQFDPFQEILDMSDTGMAILANGGPEFFAQDDDARNVWSVAAQQYLLDREEMERKINEVDTVVFADGMGIVRYEIGLMVTLKLSELISSGGEQYVGRTRSGRDNWSKERDVLSAVYNRLVALSTPRDNSIEEPAGGYYTIVNDDGSVYSQLMSRTDATALAVQANLSIDTTTGASRVVLVKITPADVLPGLTMDRVHEGGVSGFAPTKWSDDVEF